MSENFQAPPSFLFLGPVRIEYHILPGGIVRQNLLGGPILYAAAGARIWTKQLIGLISRVGEDFPPEWLDHLSLHGFATKGIQFREGWQPTVAFTAYEDWDHRTEIEPRIHFSKLGVPLPQDLVHYQNPELGEEDPKFAPELAIRPADIPKEYHSIRCAYLAPCHAFSQILLSVALREKGAASLMISPSARLFHPDSIRTLRLLVHGADIFFTTEERALRLFRDLKHDVHEAAEFIASLGIQIVLIQRGLDGVTLYDASTRRHQHFPAYPVQPKDITGMEDAFCGGFLTSWLETYDPAEAILRGLVSSSLAIEGSGGLFALERSAGLASIRLLSLRKSFSGK